MLAVLAHLAAGQEGGDHLVHLGVERGRLVGRAGDDERGAGLVDEDGVHLVHDGEVERPVDHVLQPVLHVVAQVVEAELVIRAVGDVGGVGGAAGRLVQPRHDHAGGEAQEAVELAHLGGVAPGQVVVHGNHVHAKPGQGVQVHGKGGDKGLALAGLHLGDLAVMQHHAADQLHVEMAHPQHALAGLAHHGEGLGQQVVERLARFQPGAEGGRLALERCIVQRRKLGLQRVDGGDAPAVCFQHTVVTGSEDGAGEAGKHAGAESASQSKEICPLT